MKRQSIGTILITGVLTTFVAIWYHSVRCDRQVVISEGESRVNDIQPDGCLDRVCCANDAVLSSPVEATSLLGDCVMACKFSINYCPLSKDGLTICKFKGCESKCKLARQGGCRKIPTFADCLNIYLDLPSTEDIEPTPKRIETRSISIARKRNIKCYLTKALDHVGKKITDPAPSMTGNDFDLLISKMVDGGYSPYTIETTLNVFRAISSAKLRKAYEEAVMERPLFDIPEYKFVKQEVKALTEEQKLAVEDWMTDLRRSSRNPDRQAFIALFFMRHFAVRPGDVNRLTRSNLVEIPDGHALVYIPHKTSKAAVRKVDYWIAPKLWMQIEPLIKELGPDDYLLTRHANMAIKSQIVHGFNEGIHRSLWTRINRKFKELGIERAYQLRGMRLTEAYNHGGMAEEFALSQHTSKIATTHYLTTAWRPGRDVV